VPAFDESLANDVEWIDDAPEPFAGSLRARTEFLAYAFDRFAGALPQGTQLRIERIFVCARNMVVTMWFLPAARNEIQQGYRYWWICDR
jgi:hypothetical protein